jgi:hypothetical protein
VFAIFGFQRKPHLLATIRGLCVACQDRGAHELFSLRTRFRVFFVPVVPLPMTFRTTCAGCGTSKTVSAEQADLLWASAPDVDQTRATEPAAPRNSAAA